MISNIKFKEAILLSLKSSLYCLIEYNYRNKLCKDIIVYDFNIDKIKIYPQPYFVKDISLNPIIDYYKSYSNESIIYINSPYSLLTHNSKNLRNISKIFLTSNLEESIFLKLIKDLIYRYGSWS